MILLGALMLVLVGGALGAYTSGYQNTTLDIAEKLYQLSGEAIPRLHLQSAITPKWQNERNVTTWLLMIAVPAYGWIFYAWYVGLGMAAAALFVYALLLAMKIVPQQMSEYYVRSIRNDLVRRRSIYETAGDAQNVESVDLFLDFIDEEISPVKG